MPHSIVIVGIFFCFKFTFSTNETVSHLRDGNTTVIQHKSLKSILVHPLRYGFCKFDTNKDGKISMTELTSLSGLDAESAKLPFVAADKNRKNKIF